MAGGSDARKVRLWRDRFRRYAKSAVTVEAFCSGEGVSVPTFYLWRKKLFPTRSAARSDQPRSFRPVIVTPDPQAAPRAPGRCALSVRLPGGVELDVPAGNLEVIRVVVGELTRPSHTTAAGVVPC
jgi:hypothetical protein